MEGQTVTGTITVVKADGPGWLIIAETVDEGRYRMVRELCGEEPVTEEILRFIDRLPERLAKIEGAEVELKRPAEERTRVSPKRAARYAAREVADARDPGRFQPTKAMQFKSAELEMSKACEQNFREFELSVWVRYGKKHNQVQQESGGQVTVEITDFASDSQSNRTVIVTLARHYATSPERIELLHGYSNPRKTFRIRISN
jgi:uncharacterized protein YggU (UPF0235/DUF167 family)